MKSFSAYRGATAAALPGLCLLALSMQAQATQIVVTIDAGVRTSNTEGQCLFPTPGFTGHDCSYNATNPSGTAGVTKWVGTVYSAAFFAPGAAPQASPDNFINPTLPGDGRIGIPLSGTITIDDQGNPAACSTHSIAGVIQMGGFSRNYGTQPNIRFIDDFPNGITQTLAAQVVSSGTANGAGGCDYVLGSVGVPNVMTSVAGAPVPNDPFPGQVSHTITPSSPRSSGSTEWTVPVAGTPGLARYEGAVGAPANVGLAAVSTIGPGYTCLKLNAVTQQLPPIPCGSFSNTSLNNSTQTNWDNIVGRISTNSSGNITSSLLFLVQEILVAGGDSWLAYTAAITGTAPGAPAVAVDDTASTRQDVATSINVLANDTNYVDPVTVSISVVSANGGDAVVVGSPGNQAAISVTYTPPAGFIGTDSFQYTATDGSGGNDTALVTVTVTAGNAQPVAGAGAITSITTAGFDPATRTGTINVANSPAGNSLGDAPAVVTATGATNGTVGVSGSTVTYTPLTTFFQGTGTFSYTITYVDNETATNTVTVTIPDATPTVADGTDTGNQDTVLNATGAFTPGNGSPAQHTTVITQASNGSCVASVTANSVAVAYTPDAGFSGTDSCSVQVTDGDGDSDSATFNFTVAATSAPLVIPGGPGSGSLDLWSLTLLGALPLLRGRRGRRRRV